MKGDINLLPPSQLSRRDFIIILILVSLFLSFITIILPIQQRNRLMEEKASITKKLRDSGELKDQYIALETSSKSLGRKLEILKKVNSVQGDISQLYEIADSLTPPSVELIEVSLSENDLSIRGMAPRDRIIADYMVKLQEDENIISVKAREISLDKDSLKRVFHIHCITKMSRPNIDGIDDIIEEREHGNDSLRGIGD